MDIRHDLGDYGNDNVGLTLHDLGEYIRRLGRQKKYRVVSEFKIDCGEKNHKKIDWVWLSPSGDKKLIAAFEIEGCNVAKKSIKNDCTRLSKCDAPIKMIVLYQIDHDHSKKCKSRRDPSSSLKRARGFICGIPCGISIYLDTDLFEGKIEELQ